MEKTVLKINEKLPQIIIPENKINMFIEWYNKDLYNQSNIPKAFEEGYVIITNRFLDIDVTKEREYIKYEANRTKMTYRYIENMLNEFIECTSKVTLYFKFKYDNTLEVEVYDKNLNKFSYIECQFKDGADEETLPLQVKCIDSNWEETQNIFNKFCLVMVSTSMWYLATTTKTTKYYREETIQKQINKNKKVVKVPKYKTIVTPIYDMTKIRKVKVEHLIKRRQGWTYSHAFEVHGHYRHYKDGKVIFINSYTKGKNKPKLSQTITLQPDK